MRAIFHTANDEYAKYGVYTDENATVCVCDVSDEAIDRLCLVVLSRGCTSVVASRMGNLVLCAESPNTLPPVIELGEV